MQILFSQESNSLFASHNKIENNSKRQANLFTHFMRVLVRVFFILEMDIVFWFLCTESTLGEFFLLYFTLSNKNNTQYW